MSVFQPIQVLLLHQTDSGRDNCLRLCNSAGWEVSSSNARKEALALLKQKSFDIVIADVSLDEHSAKIVKLIHSEHPMQPLIVITSKANPRDAIEALREGANDYLQQPIDLITLENSVHRAISEQKVAEQALDSLKYCQMKYEYSSADLVRQEPYLELVENLWRRGLMTLDQKLQVILAFQEALTNSLDHGNLELKSEWKEQLEDSGLDRYSNEKFSRLAEPKYADRKIKISLSYNGTNLNILIQDEGQGFDHKQQVSCIKTDQVDCFGRGLALIKSLMDYVEYSDQGRCIEMRKNLVKLNCM